jgi:hypothetical protein
MQEVELQAGQWQLGQPNVGEESLTDWVLFQLSQTLSGFYYHKFTRSQEAKETGADWDWCILTKGPVISMRVQAKRVYPFQDLYASLAHANRHGLQSELLLSSARADNLRAIYAFYAAPSPGEQIACQRAP